MDSIMLKKYRLAALAIAASGFAAAAVPAMAAEKAVTCNAPVAYVITGSEANYTIVCTGGSSAGSITNFSHKITTNDNVVLQLAQAAGSHAISTADGSITIYSNLKDTSGTAWGCGENNCRIISQLVGY
jgi:hypothetical protein